MQEIVKIVRACDSRLRLGAFTFEYWKSKVIFRVRLL